MEDVVESLNSPHYIQLQSIYNILEMGRGVRDTKRAIIHMISHLMIHDPYIQSTILNESIYTQNIN